MCIADFISAEPVGSALAVFISIGNDEVKTLVKFENSCKMKHRLKQEYTKKDKYFQLQRESGGL